MSNRRPHSSSGSITRASAFAKREDLDGRYIDTSRDGFHLALDVSSFSLNCLVRAAEPLMTAGGGVVALTYLGSERAVPKYNVMGVAKAALESAVRYLASELGEQGIRVNGLSAGPIKTLAARGIKDFTTMLHLHAERAPLRRNVDVEEPPTPHCSCAARSAEASRERFSSSTVAIGSWGCEGWLVGATRSLPWFPVR